MADESKTSSEEVQRALVASAGGSLDNLKVGTAPKPGAPAPGRVVVRVQVTGLNPVDFKMVVYSFAIKSWPAVVGCDFAGEVVQVGEGVEGLAVGDSVFGFPEIGKPGSFAEFVDVDASYVWKRPSTLSTTQASVLSVAALTAGVCLWGPTGLQLPGTIEKPTTGEELILVWGGASTAGLFALQLAAAAGYKPIAVASKKNHELVAQYGAAFAVDYHDEDVGEQIAKISDGKLRYAVDTVSAETAATVAKLLNGTAELPAKLAYIAGQLSETPEHVSASSVYLGATQSNDAQGTFVRTFVTSTLLPGLESGTLKPLPVKELNGFEGIIEGLKLLAGHKVSGTKLASKLAD